MKLKDLKSDSEQHIYHYIDHKLWRICYTNIRLPILNNFKCFCGTDTTKANIMSMLTIPTIKNYET